MEVLNVNRLHNDVVSCVNWAETELIVTGSYDHTIKLFDVNAKHESS